MGILQSIGNKVVYNGKMGKRIIKVAGVSDAHAEKNASSLFQNTVKIEEISVQKMRKLAKTVPVYLSYAQSK